MIEPNSGAKSLARGGIATLTIIIAGASLGTTPASGRVEGAGSAASQPQAIQWGDAELTLDERLAEVARRVPAFGGMFLDERGQLTMYALADGRMEQVAADDLALVLSNDAHIAIAGPIRVVPGQYSFAQLKLWRDDMNAEVLALPGVISTDIDEARNRLRVGIERAAVVGAVEDLLDWFGVPREAVRIEVVGPVWQVRNTLRDDFRPLIGGIQIAGPGFFCTLGFHAVRRGRLGFVTNSHCTEEQGGWKGRSITSQSHQARRTGLAGSSAIRGTRDRELVLRDDGAGTATAPSSLFLIRQGRLMSRPIAG